MRNILILFKTAFFFDRKPFDWQIFMQLHYLICLPSSHTCMHQSYFEKIIMLHVCGALDLLLPGHLSSLKWKTPRKGVINTQMIQCLHIVTCIPKNICKEKIYGFFLKRLGSLRVAHMATNSSLYPSSQLFENEHHNYTTKQSQSTTEMHVICRGLVFSK